MVMRSVCPRSSIEGTFSSHLNVINLSTEQIRLVSINGINQKLLCPFVGMYCNNISVGATSSKALTVFIHATLC